MFKQWGMTFGIKRLENLSSLGTNTQAGKVEFL